MSRKNKPLEKKIRRLDRSIRKGLMPTSIDLVQWLQDHHYAKDRKTAVKLIQDGRVTSDSHVLGTRIIEHPDSGEKREVFEPLVSSHLRQSLTVLPATSKGA